LGCSTWALNLTSLQEIEKFKSLRNLIVETKVTHQKIFLKNILSKKGEKAHRVKQGTKFSSNPGGANGEPARQIRKSAKHTNLQLFDGRSHYEKVLSTGRHSLRSADDTSQLCR
jgi:hypothetical protein